MLVYTKLEKFDLETTKVVYNLKLREYVLKSEPFDLYK